MQRALAGRLLGTLRPRAAAGTVVFMGVRLTGETAGLLTCAVCTVPASDPA